MPLSLIPLASHFLTGSILSLVMPVAVVVAVLVWYWIVWRRGTDERVERHRRTGRQEET